MHSAGGSIRLWSPTRSKLSSPMWFHITAAAVAIAALLVIVARPTEVAAIPGLAALLVSLASSVMAARKAKPWDGTERRSDDGKQ